MLVSNVRALCAERGITLAELERSCQFGNGSVARWGESSPSVERVKRVADYFGVTVDELLNSRERT